MPSQSNLQPRNNQATGARGESVASAYLQSKGYRIRERNIRVRFGEVDIVAIHPDSTIVFVEVKCRKGDRYGQPYEAVTRRKLEKMSKVIQYYQLKNRLTDSKLAIDVVSIILNEDNTVRSIQHFENIFTD